MKKMKLEIDALTVESFDVGSGESGGTVHAHATATVCQTSPARTCAGHASCDYHSCDGWCSVGLCTDYGTCDATCINCTQTCETACAETCETGCLSCFTCDSCALTCAEGCTA